MLTGVIVGCCIIAAACVLLIAFAFCRACKKNDRVDEEVKRYTKEQKQK